mgnify:FL=1
MADQTIAIEMKATTAAAVAEVGKLNAEIREATTAATVAGSAQQQLGKDVALTSAKVRESKEAVAGAKQALETHNATVAAFGASSTQAAQSAAKLATAEREAAKAAAVAAEATAKLAKEVQAVAAAEDGQLSPATKRAAAAVARMGETAERTAHDLNKMELQQKKGSAGFDAMGFASGKLMAVLGPAALGGTLIAVAGWLGDAAEKTLQYETALANLPFSIEGARKSTRGLVSDQQLVASAASATSLKVTATAKDFEILAGASVKLAQKLGQPADQLLNNLVTALGRGSTELLDNAGVVLKTAEAQERYAKSIGVAVSALTDEQKASAFKIEAMKAIVKAADETTLAYDSNAAKIVRLKTTTSNAWDEITRATVNASVTIAEALEDKSGQYGPMGPHWLERMVATAQALDTTWSPAFTRGAEATAKFAADLLLAGDAYEVMAQAFNPGTLAAMDAANAKEREKRDILSEEAEFSERMAKAAANVEKANTAFLDAQAAAAVVYGPAAPDKPKKKTGPKKKAGEMLDPGDVAIARTFDGVGQTEIVASAAPEAAAQGRADAEAELFAQRELRYEREAELLDAQGQREAERIDAIFFQLDIEDEAETRRRELQDQRLRREEEYARGQARNARTDAQREQAQTRLEAVEHKKRIATLTRAADEERAVLAQRRELVATVATGVTSLAGTMIGGIEALVNGQRGALARALADFTKDLAVRSGLKALEEFMLAAASAASYNFPAAAAHTTAGGMALAVAAAAGGASAGLGAAASSAAGGGAGGASGGAGGGGGAGGATGGAVAGGDTGRSSYVSDAAKLREERYLANEATNSAGYTQKEWAKFRAGGGLSQMQGWNEDGTERSRLDRLEVPRSGDRQGTMASGPVININVTGPVGKDTVRAIGETTRRAMDKTKAQGPRP